MKRRQQFLREFAILRSFRQQLLFCFPDFVVTIFLGAFRSNWQKIRRFVSEEPVLDLLVAISRGAVDGSKLLISNRNKQIVEITDAGSILVNGTDILAVLKGLQDQIDQIRNQSPAASNQSLPVGSIIMHSSSVVPDGWLLCDGRSVSRQNYAALFAVVGETFSPANSSDTFTLPDLRGRSPMGAGQGQNTTARVLGDRVGAESHKLIVAEMPSHTHTDSGHSHDVPYSSVTTGTGAAYSGGLRTPTGTVASGSSTANLLATGGNAPHPNVQPNTIVNFIIKT